MSQPRIGRSVSKGLTVGDDFESLPVKPVDYLVDTVKLNVWTNQRRDNPYRWKTGTFRLPIGITEGMHRRMVIDACKKFVLALDKQGWTLVSRLKVTRTPYVSRDLETNRELVLVGEEEFQVRASFKTVPRQVRVEIPREVVKQDPEQLLTLREAVLIG